MDVHLVDGTYELFRHFFPLPQHRNSAGEEVAATRGVLGSVLGMLEGGATHVGVATDHVIESFRNEMWAGYKTSAAVDPNLLEQFVLLENALEAMGVTVWPMVNEEADDALGAAARICAASPAVEHVYICSPDKDLSQCVTNRVLLLDRRHQKVTDIAGVREKFGVSPESIPDYLALVGDSADGFPGIPGFGAKTAATVLRAYKHLESIPADGADWVLDARVGNAPRLAATLHEQREHAFLFRDLATLRSEIEVLRDVDDLRYRGPDPSFEAMAQRLDAPRLWERAVALSLRE